MLHHAEGRCQYPDRRQAIVECVGHNWPSWSFGSISTNNCVFNYQEGLIVSEEMNIKQTVWNKQQYLCTCFGRGKAVGCPFTFLIKSGVSSSWEAFKRVYLLISSSATLYSTTWCSRIMTLSPGVILQIRGWVPLNFTAYSKQQAFPFMSSSQTSPFCQLPGQDLTHKIGFKAQKCKVKTKSWGNKGGCSEALHHNKPCQMVKTLPMD